MPWSSVAASSIDPGELARQLHAEAIAATHVPGLPPELAQALAAWRPGAVDAPLRVGLIGASDSGRTTLLAALGATREQGMRRIGLPPGIALVEGPALDPDGPSYALLEWATSLDATILLHPLRRDLDAAERRLLSALGAWGIPVQLVLARADLERPEVEGGQLLRGVRTRIAEQLARLTAQSEEIGVFALPVAVAAEAGAPGVAAAIGTLWAWAEQRADLAAMRELRHLARLLEAAAAAVLPVVPWGLAPGSGTAPALGGQPPDPAGFRALAATAWQALAGPAAPAVPVAPDPAVALLPLLAFFSEAGFAEAFAAALAIPRRDGAPAVAVVGPRAAALELVARLQHDLARARAWQGLPEETWLVYGPPPAWVPTGAVVQLAPAAEKPDTTFVLPPARGAEAAVVAALAVADAVVLFQDPRLAPELPEEQLEAIAARHGGVLHAFGDAATMPLVELARVARRTGEAAWFLYDGYDHRYTALWRLARAGGALVERWEDDGLSLAEPFGRPALEAVERTLGDNGGTAEAASPSQETP